MVNGIQISYSWLFTGTVSADLHLFDSGFVCQSSSSSSSFISSSDNETTEGCRGSAEFIVVLVTMLDMIVWHG